ncbi:hypothetical protein FKP32DRAFT_1025844 [Trametes sanguinea]|nr:hypothetical protein FKP32DRAFT_1025844 [Trametes sanguinea]
MGECVTGNAFASKAARGRRVRSIPVRVYRRVVCLRARTDASTLVWARHRSAFNRSLRSDFKHVCAQRCLRRRRGNYASVFPISIGTIEARKETTEREA